MHIPRGRRHSFIRKPCFTLCLFSCCYMLSWVTFSIYALSLSSHRVFVLDMHISLCHCALLIACSDDHLLCYVIIVLISIWLFDVWSSCSHVSHHVYLIAIYLLMCFMQVFQVTGIYVPSASQLLDLGVSEFCHYSQTHV